MKIENSSVLFLSSKFVRQCIIEMENHIIQVEFSNVNENATQNTVLSTKTKLVLPKFKPPSTVIKPEVDEHLSVEFDSKKSNLLNSSNIIVRGAYKVTNDELDDIWGTENSDPDYKSQETKVNTFDSILNAISPPRTAMINNDEKVSQTIIQ